MVSRTYSNLIDFVTGESSSFGKMTNRIPRVMTAAGIISNIDDDDDDDASSSSQSNIRDRTIVVSNQLPICVHRRPDGKGWDEYSLLLQLKDGLSADHKDMDFVYIGCLREEIPVSEQEEVAQILLESYKCVPTLLPPVSRVTRSSIEISSSDFFDFDLNK